MTIYDWIHGMLLHITFSYHISNVPMCNVYTMPPTILNPENHYIFSWEECRCSLPTPELMTGSKFEGCTSSVAAPAVLINFSVEALLKS